MNRFSTSRSLRALSVLCLFAAFGCKQLHQDKKAEGDDKATTANASAAPSGSAAPEAAGPCGELAAKFCAEAGEKGSTCGNAKATLALLSDKTCQAGLKDFATTQAKLKELAKDCDDLVKQLCAGVGPDTDSCKMVTEKTKEFPPEQCTKMLEQKDKIIEDLKKQELKNQPLSSEMQAAIAAKDAPAFGPDAATVTIVEFSDFECPYCSRAANVTTKVKEKYGEKVRFVFRQFPLSFHKNAQGAAEAALAANSQGKFWEFHDKMFENQKKLDRESMEGYAKELGLDMTKFKAELDSHQHAEGVKTDLALGEKVAVSGTPTMFINGKRISNPTDFDAVAKAIDTELGG